MSEGNEGFAQAGREDSGAGEGRSRGTSRLLVAGLALLAVVLLVGLWIAARPAPLQLQGMVDADEVNVATKALATRSIAFLRKKAPR